MVGEGRIRIGFTYWFLMLLGFDSWEERRYLLKGKEKMWVQNPKMDYSTYLRLGNSGHRLQNQIENSFIFTIEELKGLFIFGRSFYFFA